MSTVKISELAPITVINANTANTLLMGVDIPTGVTGKFTAHTLAQGLYLNEVLNVGNNSVVFPNTIAQFSGNSVTYLQMNMQNFTSAGSGDFIITADTGTNANSFVDLGINNSTFSDAAYSSMKPYDGYLYVHGPSDAGASGNLIVGTAAANANVSFIIGGTTSDNVVAKLTKTALELQRQITFADGTSQNTSSASAGSYANAAFLQANTPPAIANSAAVYANGAFIQANAAYAQSNTVLEVNLTQNTSITSAFTQANSAYTKANNALANTSGTFAGDLNITGTLKASGVITLNNSSFAINTAFLSIVASDDFSTVPPSNTNYMIHVTGKANSVTRVVLDSFGQNTYPLVAGRMGRGSAATPTAVANNDIMMRVVGNGYTGTTFPGSSPTKIDFVASENFSDTNRGTRIEFWNTPLASNTIQKIASFNANSVEFSGVVNPQRGFIFTPRVLQGAQTAITVDFTSDSMIRGTFAATVTTSFTNYTYGKVVEMWLTNTAGNGQTIVHGCLANNSTIGATSFAVASGRSAHLKYFSIDGDLANTFVAITYA